ncbi:hypothetical protein ACS5PN_27850 [Roseateles sp. NT4]|uniref:hypothetical protein n=1 Tax=Roseateles sp. NT4 TaxID=3453715 RepID=UPI003EE861D1
MSDAQWSHPRFLFASGCPEENRAWFIAQDGDTFRMIQLKDEKWIQRALPWDAVALCGTLLPALQLLIFGVDGEVLHISPAGMANEKIQTPQSDPSRVGMLRGARYIDGLPHVVGMGPQVYRREVDGRWTSLGHTLRPESKGTKRVKGFHAIDGFSHDHLLAVGHAAKSGVAWLGNGRSWTLPPTSHSMLCNVCRMAQHGSVDKLAPCCASPAMQLICRLKAAPRPICTGLPGSKDRSIWQAKLRYSSLTVVTW